VHLLDPFVPAFNDKMSDFGSTPTMTDMQGYLEPEQVHALIAGAKNFRDTVILTLLWTTGCRLSEMLMITVEDISFKDNVLYIWTLKRKLSRRYQRVVPMDGRTMTLIQEYLTKYRIKTGPLFSIKRRRVGQIVTEIGQRVGIPRVGSKGIHPHHFRHSHAVRWVRTNKGMESLKKLQQRLGHASFATTAHYLQFDPSEQRAELDAFFDKDTE